MKNLIILSCGVVLCFIISTTAAQQRVVAPRPQNLDQRRQEVVKALSLKSVQVRTTAIARAMTSAQQTLKAVLPDVRSMFRTNNDKPCPGTTTPVITSVSQITPGVDFFVQGQGFDFSDPDLHLQVNMPPDPANGYNVNYVQRATITSWSGCSILARITSNWQVPTNATSAEASRTCFRRQNAVVWLNKMARDAWGHTLPGVFSVSVYGNATYLPELDGKADLSEPIAYVDANTAVHDLSLFNYSLQNDWYIVDAYIDALDSSTGSGAKVVIVHPPTKNVPNGSAHTDVRVTLQPTGGTSGYVAFYVVELIAGPKGCIPH